MWLQAFFLFAFSGESPTVSQRVYLREVSIMTIRYAVRMLMFASGERFPVLIDLRTGIPDFDVTAFQLSEFRQVSRGCATLEHVARACPTERAKCQ